MDSGFVKFDKVVKDTMEILKKFIPAEQLKPAGAKADSRQLINSFPIEWFREWEEYGFDMKEAYNFDYKVSFTFVVLKENNLMVLKLHTACAKHTI